MNTLECGKGQFGKISIENEYLGQNINRERILGPKHKSRMNTWAKISIKYEYSSVVWAELPDNGSHNT